MKKHILLSGIAGLLLAATVTEADFYAGAGLGMGFNGGSAMDGISRRKYKDAPVYSLSGGYELPLPLFDLRGEVEYLRTRPDVKNSGSRRMDGLFMNVYGDIPLIPIIDPYVGLGIGKVRFDHRNSFAVQGMLGAEYELPFAPITVAGEYRYLKVNDRTGKVNASSKYHTNTLMLKFRYMF